MRALEITAAAIMLVVPAFAFQAPAPARIVAVGETALSGVAGSTLSVAVQVFDTAGTPVRGARVTFRPRNGTVVPGAVDTDANGRAQATFTVGRDPIPAGVTATVAGLQQEVVFTVTLSAAAAITAVVNAATFTNAVAPGSIISIYVENATLTTASAELPLPTTLGGVSITVNNRAIPLLYVGAAQRQINAQLPYEIQPGQATAVLTAGTTASVPFAFNVQQAAPGILMFGNNRAVATNPGGSINTAENGARPGDIVTVYMVGSGATTPAVSTAAQAPTQPLAMPVLPSSATIGGRDSRIDFLGLTPGSIGLVQANIEVPDLSPGDHPVMVTIGQFASNTPLLTVRAP
jgi:uncharacterized protein (TIGR03437 family)